MVIGSGMIGLLAIQALPGAGCARVIAVDPMKRGYREKGKLRTYLWLRELDYVVVLKGVPPAAPRYYFLITAFHLSGDSQRRNMRRRHEEREP